MLPGPRHRGLTCVVVVVVVVVVVETYRLGPLGKCFLRNKVGCIVFFTAVGNKAGVNLTFSSSAYY